MYVFVGRVVAECRGLWICGLGAYLHTPIKGDLAPIKRYLALPGPQKCLELFLGLHHCFAYFGGPAKVLCLSFE